MTPSFRHIATALLLLASSISAQTTYDPKVLPKGHEYFELRDGLGNAQLKFEREQTGRIAFLGGSITAGGGWRDHTMKYFQAKFPQTKFEFIAAGIGSMGSVPHAFRLEFSIDGAYRQIETFTHWSTGLHLPWALILDDGLQNGPHTAKVRIASGHDAKGTGTALRVFHLLLN